MADRNVCPTKPYRRADVGRRFDFAQGQQECLPYQGGGNGVSMSTGGKYLAAKGVKVSLWLTYVNGGWAFRSMRLGVVESAKTTGGGGSQE